MGGNEYFGVVVDDATGFVHAIFVRNKSDFGKQVTEWLEYAERRTGKVKVLRSDNAGEHEENFLLGKTTRH